MSTSSPPTGAEKTSGSSGKKLGIIAVVIALVAALAIAWSLRGGDDSTPSASDGTPIVEDHSSEVLVDAAWVQANAANDDVVLIEVSTDPGLYERGHIDGAVNLVWTEAFVDQVTRDIVSRDDFTEIAREAGVNDDSTIVLYGDSNNWFAAWGAWVFKLYGHENVKLLDGGRVNWDHEGLEYVVEAPNPTPGTWEAAEADDTLRAFLPEVKELAIAADKGETPVKSLVDIRGPAEYNGEIFAAEGFQELSIRAGHIPGASNITWGTTVDPETGKFLPVDELRALYADKGIDGSKSIITYCRIGERAAHSWFLLSEVLGYDVALYDGSWTEYGNSVGVPIVNNAGTVWGVA